jgi:carboxymethylenebutenolidase
MNPPSHVTESSMPATTTTSQPRQLSAQDITPAVVGVLDMPSACGTHPGVILLPGSAGWHPAFNEMTRELAEAGFAALSLDYLGEGGRNPSADEKERYFPVWQQSLRNAVTFLRGHPAVLGEPIGIVGYSLGAFLALCTAPMLSGIGAIVEFFGWMEPLTDDLCRLPPVLIIHGEADTMIPVSRAYGLRAGILRQGGQVEMHIYPGMQHAFNASWGPFYSEPEAADSMRRTIDFLSLHLGRQGKLQPRACQ